MKIAVKVTVAILSALVNLSECAKILAFFPAPSISHQVVFRPLTQELARRGHDVTIITPDPAYAKGEAAENITEIDLHDVSYEMWSKGFVSMINGKQSSMTSIEIAFPLLNKVFEEQISTKEFKKVLSDNKKFDLILLEACVRPALIMTHLFNAPAIQVSSFGALYPNFPVMGTSTHPLFYPEVMSMKFNELSLLQKMEQILIYCKFRWLMWNLEKEENEMLRRNFGPAVPTLTELSNNIDMLFVNAYTLWDSNRPVPPGFIYLGALHKKSPKALPEELQSYLDNSKHGVIYMSFGTNVDPTLLSADRIKVFKNVFSNLPYDVLWKWNGDNMTGKPDNVRISKWLPQSDLLRHPKIKLFITQGGLQSTDESISAKVPLIAFPMLGDQWFNAEMYEYHKIGKKLNIETINEDTLYTSIKEVIEESSYRKNIAHLSEVMYDQPQSPLERAVWWTEYVIRHKGAKLLRSATANISWTEYLMLDVVLTLVGISFVIVVCIIIVVRRIVSLLYKSKKLKQN